MTPNAFIGRKEKPTDADLAEALGEAKPVWDRLLAELAAECGIDSQEWKSYSIKQGWALRMLRGKRTIVWLSACPGCIRVAFILGDKAVAAARAEKTPAKILKLLDSAVKYPEGNGVRLEIKSARELPTVMRLAALKLAH